MYFGHVLQLVSHWNISSSTKRSNKNREYDQDNSQITDQPVTPRWRDTTTKTNKEIKDLTWMLMLYWNLLNECWKSDKMRVLPNILFLFCNSLDKFNNTGARILDSIYHRTLQDIKISYLKSQFSAKTSNCFAIFTQRYNGRHNLTLLKNARME